MASLKDGKLYELKLDFIEGVPIERLCLGYFYVQKDKIYKIELTEENLNKVKKGEGLPDSSVIVCQDKELKDTLSKDEPGFHHYLEVDGDKREYHSYNNQVSTGYYESYTWDKGKGLINYRSGYGAERDSIELQLKNGYSSTPKAERLHTFSEAEKPNETAEEDLKTNQTATLSTGTYEQKKYNENLCTE